MIVVSRNLAASSGETLMTVAATLLVFFVAHAYAATVARLADSQAEGVRAAMRQGMRRSLGLLTAGAIPLIVLALGVIGLVRQADAVWLALVVDWILLGLLGWFVVATRTAAFWPRLGGALLIAACGAVMILLKVIIHR